MLNILKKLLNGKRLFKAMIFVMIIAVFLVNVKFVLAADVLPGVLNAPLAGLGGAISLVLGWIALLLTAVIGALITVVVWVLIQVAQYGNIINVPTVIQGWVIIRDLCNMSFILILLVIAFATILRQENFSAKKLLPKLLIMAVLINFSRTIFGLMIDVSQIIMLTFVNAFAAGGGHFIAAFNTDKLLAIKPGQSWGDDAAGQWSIVMAIIAGVLAAIITLIVVSVMLAVLVARIVMLWIYTIFSPLIFMGFAVPALQKYTGKLWEDFVKQLIVGPVLAFFIWLALTTASGSYDLLTGGQTLTASGSQVCTGAGAFFCEGNFQKFIIVIGLLMGGLMVAQQMGGAAGSIAGKGLDWAKKSLAAPLVGAKTLANYGIDKLHQKTGVDLNVARVWTGIQEKRKEIKSKRYGEGMTKAAEVMRERGRLYGALAMTGTPGTAWEQLTTKQGWGARLRGGKGSKETVGKKGEGGQPGIGLMGEQQIHEENIKTLESDKMYKKSDEISQSLTSQQRAVKLSEKFSLEKEIHDNEGKMNTAKAEVNTAKTAGDSVGEKEAQDKYDDLKKQNESKINQYQGVERALAKLPAGMTSAPSDTMIASAEKYKKNHEVKISKEKDEVKKVQDKALKYKPIMDYDAISAQSALESTEMKKIENIKDREEKSSMLRDAMKKRDKTRFNAIALSLSKDGNGNDGVLNNLGFSSDAKGLNELIESVSEHKDEKTGKMVKGKNYMGYTEQEGMALGMKLSYSEEDVNHWATARAFTMENGRYRNSSSEEQAMAAASEVAKMDPQMIARSLNRLGFSGETPDGKFVLNDYGLALIKAIGPKLAAQIDRLNPNAAARLALPENIELMVQAKIAPEFISALQAGGKTKSTETLMVGDAISELKKMSIAGRKYFQKLPKKP